MAPSIFAQSPANGRRLLMIVAALGALAYVGVAAGTDSHKLAAALRTLGGWGCCLVLGLSAVNYLLRFLRWRYYIQLLGHELAFWQHLLVYLSGFALTVSPGKGGEAVRSLYMRDHGVPYAESLAALFVERLIDLLAMVLLCGLLISGAARYAPLLVCALLAVLALMFLAGRRFLPDWIDTIRIGRSAALARAIAGLANLLRSSHTLLQLRPGLTGLALGLVSWGAEGLGLYFILQGLQLDANPAGSAGIYTISALAGAAAFFMPGGIGGMEVAMTSLLVADGAALSSALIATLLCRLATLWFAVIIGIVATVLLESRIAGTVPKPSSI